MPMFSQIFKFELSFHFRQPLIYVVSLILFLLSFMAVVSDNLSLGGIINNININSPFNVIWALSMHSFICSLVAGVAYASSPILRDFDNNVAELFFTTRVSKFDYLMARFCGALVFCFLVYCAALLGVFLGEFMPWLDPERLGPTRFDAYWFGTWAVALPNVLFVATMVFLIATLTRSVMASYVVLMIIVVVSAVLGTVVDPEQIRLLSLLDPFGQVALQDITRYWTPFQRNELIVPLEGNFLYNRLMLLGLMVGFMVAAYRFFPFSLDFNRGRGSLLAKFRRNKKQESPANTVKPASIRQRFDFPAQISQLGSMLRMEIHNILLGKAFIVMALVGLVQVLGNAAVGLSGLFGTEIYPTTTVMVGIINGGFSLPLIVVLVFYSSELLVRERNYHVSEILDSMPYPNWVVIAAKLLGLMLVIAFMLIAVMLGGIIVQLFKGYYDLEIMHYLLGLFVFFQFPIWFLCVLAVFTQVITGQRYLGMFAFIVFLLGTVFLPQQGFDHYLYLFGTPQIPYSVFTGYDPNLTSFLWYTLYWGLFCFMLLIAMHLLWQRGSEQLSRFKWKNIGPRFTRPVVILSSLCLLAFIGTGRFIYYNTVVLNPHISNIAFEQRTADYEKAYKQYEGMQIPDLEKLYTEVDIYPARSEANIRGVYTLRNNNETPLEELHLNIATYLTINELDVPGTSISMEDEGQGYYIYNFEPALQPGEVFELTFDLDWLTPGFVNRGATTRLLSNGTFFNNAEAFPLIGYQKGSELLDNNRRRKYDLPPAERMAKIDDESQWDTMQLSLRKRIDFEAIVSTSADQIAVTPGYLQREWEEDDRRYFHYKMDDPIWPFVSFLSADYEVAQASWNDVNLEVYYKHGVNVERMLEASQKALDYFTTNFSPYQYGQYRIFEFPQQRGTFAQSFPNTIPFSEAIGFVADLRDPEDIDYVFYVTAHELAHQWWAHQVIGANVQGSAVLTETLSQYSALMVMEKEYGPAHMQRFLKYELDRYLSSRGSEVLEELPLYLVENQGYIHYRKGSLVLYALKDYLGEETVNRILSEFIDEWGFQAAPFPTTKDLIAKIRENAAPEYQSIITDLFEKIVLFDLRAEDSTFEELPNGRFEVTVNTSASKFEADGEGEETQVAMDSFIDIAVLGEDNEDTKIPEVIHIEKLRVNNEEQTFVFQVDTRPVSVGIDPFNKLIDRNPDDNVKSVVEAD